MSPRSRLRLPAGPTRRAVVAGGVLAGATALAGCNPGGSSKPKDAKPVESADKADFKGKKLSYMYFTDGPDEQATRDLIAAFQKEYGCTVDLEIVPFADLTTTLQARLSGDQAPDVARVANHNAFDGDLLELDEFLGEDFAEEFIEGVRVGMKNSDGKTVAVASDLTMNGPFVNTDQFEKAGVEVPTAWTWQEMVEAATKVQQANGTEYALAIDKSGHRLSTILSQGGTYLVQDGKTSFDPEKATTALEPLLSMITEGTSPSDFWLDSGTKYQGANEVFLAQQAPVYISGNWQVAQFDKDADFGWKAVPNPKLKTAGGFPGGKFMVGFAAGKENQLAATFLKFMNTAESQKAFITSSNFLPTRADLAKEGVQYSVRPEDMAVFLSDLEATPKEAYACAYDTNFDAAAQELVKSISTVVAGQKELAPAMDELKSALEKVVEAG